MHQTYFEDCGRFYSLARSELVSLKIEVDEVAARELECRSMVDNLIFVQLERSKHVTIISDAIHFVKRALYIKVRSYGADIPKFQAFYLQLTHGSLQAELLQLFINECLCKVDISDFRHACMFPEPSEDPLVMPKMWTPSLEILASHQVISPEVEKAIRNVLANINQ